MHEPDVTQLLDAWLERGRHHWSPSTMTTHVAIARRLIAALGDEPITALSTARIEGYYGELATELAPATIHRVHSVLLSALSLAVRWGWIDRNPAVRAARRPRAHRSHAIDPDGLARVVVGTPPSSTFGVLARVAGVTGARRGELCALRVADLDASQATLRIARAIAVGPESERVERETKTGRVRTIGLDRGTVALVETLLERRAEHAASSGMERAPDPFLFSPLLAGDRPFGPHSVTALWSRWRRRIAPDGALDHVRFGDLRHLAVTRLLNAGVPVTAVAHRVGHATPATTLRNYAHALPVRDHDAADLLAVMFQAPRTGAAARR